MDEFNDESGTDEAEGSNDLYCASSDYYINSTSPDGSPSSNSYSAGFGLPTGLPYSCGSITEPDTSTAQRNSPQAGYTASPTGRVNIDQDLLTFTVPTGMTSLSVKVWGAGGGAGCGPATGHGGGGGFTTGNLAVTPGQVLYGLVGYGGGDPEAVSASPGTGVYANAPTKGNQVHLPGTGGHGGSGGGLSAIFTADFDYLNKGCGFAQDGATLVLGSPVLRTNFSPFVPSIAFIAGAGGGASRPSPTGTRITGGAGGGLIGEAGGGNGAQITAGPNYSGGGSQSQGGEGGGPTPSESSTVLISASNCASGGSGYYAGGSGGNAGANEAYAGGGGSSYYGHPQVTCGSTEGGAGCEGGGVADPAYVACTNEGVTLNCGNLNQIGEQGYILITGCASITATATSTTIISTTFAATNPVSTSRIVVFEENVDTPTINTDIIASVSRDGGSTFTNATLSDSGYVTGSSGQRILTGQADISGQPTGQSMRWKLQLANNQVKIHGVSLQWA